jgi:hypothetical protein
MALIGISGKAGSGKDTVGKIIQYLITEYKIENSNIHPTTFEQFCDDKYNELFGYCDWKVVKFASKLKQIVSILTGIPVEDLEKQEVKDRVLGKEWDRVTFNPFGKNSDEIRKQITVRQLLQEVGTDAMRNVIHPNIWVNALFADYKKPIIASMSDSQIEQKIKEGNFSYPNWIITDLRFPNELEAIKQKGGITIRIHRDLHKGNAHIAPIPHISETSLDHITDWDYVIDNNGSIEDLIEKVKEILIKEKII